MEIFGTKTKTELGAAVAESARNDPNREWQPPPKQFVELGTIDYVNLTADGKHGELETAVNIAKATGKPIFANFVEWSG